MCTGIVDCSHECAIVGVVIMQLPTGTSFYGTGEVGGGLERTGKRVCNLTVFY